MNIKVKRSWWIGAVVTGALVFWRITSGSKAIEVDVTTVSIGPLRVTINEAGTTRVRAHADINASVAARWVPSAMRAGDIVAVGAVLGVLYPAPLDAAAQQQVRARLGAAEAARNEAETRVTAARSALDEATRTLTRAERMLGAGAVSPQEVERVRASVVERRADVGAAEQRVRSARYDLESARAVVAPLAGNRSGLRIEAPAAGTALRVYEEHERVVAPGTPLAEVGDPRDLEIVIPLLTTDAARVREGAAVVMTLGSGEKVRGDTLRGRVTRVEPSAFTKVSALGVEEQRVNVIARVPATDAHVGDQYRVQARIVVWESPSVLRLASGALVRDGERWFVYLIDGNRARARTVTLGERGEAMVEVRGGLVAGDRVVLFPGDRVVDGGRVKATDTGAASHIPD